MLLFDIGNTRLKWAHATLDKIVTTGAINLIDLNDSALNQHFDLYAQPKSILISNVASDDVLALVQAWFEARFNVQAEVIKVTERIGSINNAYTDISSLGVDRWMAAIGARYLVEEGDLIIVDAGTAVTIDWLSADNSFEGGVILPGLALMHDSLVGRTAGIKSEFSDRSQIIGKTTKECVNSGISFGLAGAIERIVEEMNKNINRPTKVILTGGAAKSLAVKLKINTINESNLVLLGLLKLGL